MTDEAHDMALAALLTSAREVAPDLPEELIRKIYVIQSRHQFNRDRVSPLEEMRHLVEDHVAAAPPPPVVDKSA
jgi:hypothetical protein